MEGMSHVLKGPRIFGRASAILSALVLAASMFSLIGPATTAQAASCTSAVHDSFGVESVITFDWAPQCSDGAAQIWGSLRDAVCDGRAASAGYTVYDKLADGSYTLVSNKGYIWNANNGCNTTQTFTDRTNSPGAVGWELIVRVVACNGNGCSTTRTKTYTR